MIYLDLDDFCESNNSLDLLHELKREVPKLKVTLFTIPGLCSQTWLGAVKQVPWFDLVPHGWMHPHPRECQNWTREQTLEYLDRIASLGLTHGWKAPGWQISDGTYQALLERGYWVADQVYNNARRPAALRAYLLDKPERIHGHIGHLGGFNSNELSRIAGQILQHKESEFGFVRDTF